MAQDVAAWLAGRRRLARTVTVKVRYTDFRTVTRSQTLPAPTRDADLVVATALELLGRTEAGARPVRLLGVSLHNLADEAEAAAGRLPFGDDAAG